MYPINEQLISNNRSYEKLRPEGFVIHSTDTPGATDENERSYFNSGYHGASVHYFADWDSITKTVPENEVAWHAGSTANHKYLSVEMCEPRNDDPDRFRKFEEVWNRTVWLVADACVRYGWSTGPDVWSHNGISRKWRETDHTDPYGFLQRYGRTWDQLLAAIDAEIEELKRNSLKIETPPITPSVTISNDSDVYLSVRVRTSKADDLVNQIIGMGYACKKLDLA